MLTRQQIPYALCRVASGITGYPHPESSSSRISDRDLCWVKRQQNQRFNVFRLNSNNVQPRCMVPRLGRLPRRIPLLSYFRPPITLTPTGIPALPPAAFGVQVCYRYLVGYQDATSKRYRRVSDEVTRGVLYLLHCRVASRTVAYGQMILLAAP